MKDHFNRFALRFLLALVLGLVLLLCHSWNGLRVTEIFAPRYANPWELSKLAYWPMLGALALTCRQSGGGKGVMLGGLPSLVVTPLALFLVFWLVSNLAPGGGVYLALWAVATAIGLALADREAPRSGRVWLVLGLALGAAYVLFTFLPPMWGPFLDPSDVAAMGRLPC